MDTDGAKSGRRAEFPELFLLGLASVVAILLTVALVIRLSDAARPTPAAAARERVMKAGAVGVAAVLSYDYRTVDRLVATNRPLLTTACAAGYAAQIGGVTAQVTQNKVVLAATVRAAAVQSIDVDRASVLVIVDEKRTGSDRAEQSSQLSVSISLVQEGGKWLVDDMVPAGALPSGSISAQRCA